MNMIRSAGTRTLGLLVLALALLLPVGLAAPAHAAGEPTVSIGGCLATVKDPVHAGFNAAGVKLVKFSAKIDCDGWRSVTIHQRAYEEDLTPAPASWYVLGFKEYKKDFLVPWPSSTTVSWTTTLPNTEAGNEEMGHKIRISVTKDNVSTQWSPWRESRIVSMPN